MTEWVNAFNSYGICLSQVIYTVSLSRMKQPKKAGVLTRNGLLSANATKEVQKRYQKQNMYAHFVLLLAATKT